MIDVRLLGNSNIPSLSDLQKARFALVGTEVTAQFGPGDWTKVASWIASAHSAGLRAFIMIGAWAMNDASKAIDWTRKAASIGADQVDLDELIVRLNVNETVMHSIIESGLAVNSNLQFTITEYRVSCLQLAYSWTTEYKSVRVADDDFNNKPTIVTNVNLGLNYGKRAYTWLIFNGGSEPFDCASHLDNWIAYVKQTNTDVLFYYINGGPWQLQWLKVQSF